MTSVPTSFLAALLFGLASLAPLRAQAPDSLIQHLIDDVNLDSIVQYVRALSGEDSVMIGSQKRLITSRANGAPTQDWAADYIHQTMTGFGLVTTNQTFGSGGRNVFAIQPGTSDSEVQYILCAHYDAVTTHCADDNATGVAAVMEAARLLSTRPVAYTIVYALWDQEEIGLNGSEYYASLAHADGDDIQGVINLEMFGWDGNNDGLVDIHTRPIAASVSLAQTIRNLDSVYNLGLNPVVYNPGTSASDHSSFWYYNYSAVVFSEAYYGGDFNPYYHSSNDRIQYFNLPYFLKLSKLAAASIATYADLHSLTATRGDPKGRPTVLLFRNYPNPFNASTTIEFELDHSGSVRLEIFNAHGQEVASLIERSMERGFHRVVWNAGSLASGVYFYRLQAGSSVETKKLILLK